MAKAVYTNPQAQPTGYPNPTKQATWMKRSDGSIVYVRPDGTIVEMPKPAKPSSIIRGASVFPMPKDSQSKA